MKTRKRCEETPIRTWPTMKAIMRKRFIPSLYSQNLHRRLQILNQGTLNVDEYFKELETLLIRADIHEDEEVTIAHFIVGLNSDIAEVVELQCYVEL